MAPLFRNALSSRVIVIALGLSLAACTDNPQALNRPGDVPPAFTSAIDKAAPIWPKAGWWANFGSDELTPLERTAQSENLDIAQAPAQVLKAEANDDIALAALFPTLGANPRVNRVGSSKPTFNSQTRTTSGTHNSFIAGMTASYKQAFFGPRYF